MLFREQCRQANLPCWICNQPIDWDARDPAPLSFTKDHYWPKSLRPELKYHVSNFRPAHKICNNRRANRRPDETHWIGTPFEGIWWEPPPKHTKTAPNPHPRPQGKRDRAESHKHVKRKRRQRTNLKAQTSQQRSQTWQQLLRDHQD